MKKSRIIFLVAIVILGVIAVIFLLNNNSDNRIAIETEDATKREITEIVSANGKINPITQVKLSPDVSGEIVTLNVVEGDVVKRGDLLVRIKPDTYESMLLRSEASLNSSYAQLEQIKAQLIEAKQSYERSVTLYDKKAITQKEFEQAQSAYNSLEAQKKSAEYNIESSKAAVKESRENLEKTSILAPMDGVISKLNVELGERVVGTGQMAGTEMMIVANLNMMEINAEINENDIVSVSKGDSAVVEIDAYPSKKFKGVVSAVANSANQTTSLEQVTNFKVDIYILPESYKDLVTENNPFPLRPGLSTSIEIATERKNCISVPIESIATRESDIGKLEELIYIYNSDSLKVYERVVTSGIQDIKHIEVSNLNEGEKVVIAPIEAISKELKDGMSVKLKNNEKKENK